MTIVMIITDEVCHTGKQKEDTVIKMGTLFNYDSIVYASKTIDRR